MQSSDIVEGNVAKIAALFPQCVTECRDMPTACCYESDGGQTISTCQRHVPTVRYKIDWDKLRAELEPDLIQDSEERYQFTWPDKRAASRLANQPTDKTLRPDVDASVDFWNTENLYIEGDNLDVLKVLRENYLGAIKMIYIDPPYNIGNDFVYNDGFGVNTQTEESRNGLFDDDGMQVLSALERNTASNGRFHTDWLNMIYPRLKVSRDLLSIDGAIFISIDDNEVDNLRKMCNEIFGENNFLASIIWKRKRGRDNSARWFSKAHEYCLIYAKHRDSFETNYLPLDEETKQAYRNPDNDPRGIYRMLACWARGTQGGVKYDFTSKSGEYFSERLWLFSKSNLQKLDEEDKLIFKGDNVYRKMFIYENKGKIPETLWDNVSNAANASDEIKSDFGSIVFDTPKPTPYIMEMLRVAMDKDGIFLDFFSGSSTSAKAVMKLNAEDGGKRKFIMVQLPEVTDEKSEARKAGYENICQIGEERIRRAGKKIKEEMCRDMPLACSKAKAMVTNETSRSDVPTLDIGFRVLKLDSSNMKDVYYTPDEFDKESLFDVDNVKPGRSALDLLFQVMPELNIELSAKIEMKEVNGKKVYFVNGNYLIATFDKDVNESTVTEIARMRPVYFVMRDASAANDNVLDNFEQIFRHYSPDTICKIL